MAAQSKRDIETLEKELEERNFIFMRDVSNSKHYVKWVCRKDQGDMLLKIVDKRLLYLNQEIKQAFIREFQVGKRVGGAWQHLAAFFDFFYLKNHAVIVYEYYSKGTLEENIQIKNSYEYNEALVVSNDLIRGLEELKLLGLIHKNLDAGCVYLGHSCLKIGGFEFCEFSENNSHRTDANQNFSYNFPTLRSLNLFLTVKELLGLLETDPSNRLSPAEVKTIVYTLYTRLRPRELELMVRENLFSSRVSQKESMIQKLRNGIRKVMGFSVDNFVSFFLFFIYFKSF